MIARIIVIAVIAAATYGAAEAAPGVSAASWTAMGVAVASFGVHVGRGAWGRALLASALAALAALVLVRYGLSVLMFAYPELATPAAQAWQAGLLVAWLGGLGLFDRPATSGRGA